MTEREKKKILVFAREAFKKFYNENPKFLTNNDYKPGKRVYRNMLSLNKMMSFYTNTSDDYILKKDAIDEAGWSGPSSYVQHERIITNFGLSDTSWEDRTRPVLLLSDKGIEIRDKYREYKASHPGVDLMELTELPDFAIDYFVDEIRLTTSKNMTLWKNTIITSLYFYADLGYIKDFSVGVKAEEERAFRECINYVREDGELMDLTYMQQPIAMLKNLRLINDDCEMTEAGYELLKNMRIFNEVEASIDDFEVVFEESMEEVEEILDSKIMLEKVDTPERRERKSKVTTSDTTKPRNRDHDKANKESKLTGDLGEKLVLDYERKRLRDLSITDVEEKVFLTSSKKEKYGNAYPCDIISYDPATGHELFIEVKTTKGGINTPFFISDSEVQFSKDNADFYRLYRVFDALKDKKPKFYETIGKVDDNFSLETERYLANRTIE